MPAQISERDLAPKAGHETLKFDDIEVAQTDTARLKSHRDDASSTVLSKGHVKKEGFRPFPTDVRFEFNQPFKMRDNVSIRVDIFRPVSDEPVPALVQWSPYGKSGSGPMNLGGTALRVGVAESRLSGYESFEGLDPAEWVGKGYAVINVDARGAGDSEGNLRWWGSPEGEDGYDLIEHIAEQKWCTGRVALAGNSWLAVSQWFIAAQQPPHLAAIAPLEGMTDVAREHFLRGGIPFPSFSKMVQSALSGFQQQEDLIAMSVKYPDMNAYWADKRADMTKINVPAYILGSYSTNLHTDGAFRAFEEIQHDKKWLTVHSSQEWHDLYSEARSADLAKFFDFYLKGEKNDWEETPSVRQSFLGYNAPNEVLSYPHLPWTQPEPKKLRLYLNADHTMSPHSTPGNGTSATLHYQADVPGGNADDDAEEGELLFSYTFPEKSYVAGNSKVVINCSAEIQDDLDVYVMLRKADCNGQILQSINQPLSDLGVADASQVPTVSVLKYLGPQGVIRASKRTTSPELSTSWRPVLALSGNTPVPRGEIVELQLSLWPTGMIFEKGEKLVLKVSGHDMRLVDFAFLQGKFQVANKGKHYVHCGEGHENYLDLYLI